ncbi:hypothetical protein [Avibacterium paragallinarum]|uniref:hypothetical protein n=1 Tax=Avibacterium paragallinarum TaxID=728 RepID=UPI000614DE0A|nr:hypothetical protein [Avibacterium paragallinarum]KAA6209296.1 hypothetical protein F1968_04610 [Avibacterium paragallinarum]KKB01570.1 hypothetical protein Z012_05900 [Avibacterium paragallinarum]RZN58615.1 hypothetical protein EIG78_04065 [Avibacterium paragallinarum]RZN72221.1 hypothetical protein EIG77_06005 [Avibacterium paragallinarum]WAL56620.1 hypothetical protein OY678_11920 [Avibacterium paragallinarum]
MGRRKKEELVLTPELEANLRARRFLTVREFAALYHKSERQVTYAIEKKRLKIRERETGRSMFFIDMVASQRLGGTV